MQTTSDEVLIGRIASGDRLTVVDSDPSGGSLVAVSGRASARSFN